MNRNRTLLALAVWSLCGVCRGQFDESTTEMPSRQGSELTRFTLDGKEKATCGSQGYRASNTTLLLGMPHGFNVSGGANVYKSDTSSATPTLTIGAGKDWDQVSLGVSYAAQGLANDVKANTFSVSGSVSTESKDFRTTMGAEVAVTHDIDFTRFPKVTSETDITQRTSTIRLKQRYFGTAATVELSESKYNRNLAAIAVRVNKLPKIGRYAGALGGLVAGFPDWTAKFGLYHDFEAAPLTLWGTYESIHFVNTVQLADGTSDTYVGGADYELGKYLTASLEYEYLRQTSSPSTRLYSAALAVRL